jgi:hypothetical protein
MMDWINEWKKLIACLVMLAVLFVIKYTGQGEMDLWISQLLDYIMVLLGAGAVKYSVLSTSEREFISPPDDDNKFKPGPSQGLF